jgi:DNA-binding beta-propeller fold protein YncE
MTFRSLIFLCGLVCLNSLPVLAETEEMYRFERMWPVLQQPWYFDDPTDVAVDQQGNVYVADAFNRQVKKLTSNGHLISQWQFDNDDSSVIPHRITIDSHGNPYVLYRMRFFTEPKLNVFVRILTPYGEIIDKWTKEDLPKDERPKISDGDLAMASNGNIYVAGRYNRVIRQLTPQGQLIKKWFIDSVDGEEIDSEEHLRIAIDNRHELLYVVDKAKNRVLKYTLEGEFVKQWGKQGREPGDFYFPSSIAIDSHGNIYVTDTQNNRIQKFNQEGELLLIWGNEDNVNAAKWQKVLKESPFGEFTNILTNPALLNILEEEIFRLPGDVELLSSPFLLFSFLQNKTFLPSEIAIGPQDNIYVSYEFPDYSLRKYTPEGELITQWSNRGTRQKFKMPADVTRDKPGNLYITDTLNHRVVKTTAEGQFITAWGELGNGDGQFLFPFGIAVDSKNHVYVVDMGNFRIQKFSSEGQFLQAWGGIDNSLLDILKKGKNLSILEIPKTTSLINELLNQKGCQDNKCFFFISHIAIDSRDNVYVVDSFRHRINQFTSDGEFINAFGQRGDGDSEFNVPLGISVDNTDNIYVVDLYKHDIKKFTTEGKFLNRWGSYGEGEGQFNQPYDVATDEDGNVYVSDAENERLQKFTPDGQFITQWGDRGTYPGQFNQLSGLTVSPEGDRVYVVEPVNNRIQVFNQTFYDVGKAIIVAGGGPYDGNDLWDDTQMVANFAYRALAHQGFTQNTIYYLSAATTLDLDNNCEYDEGGVIDKSCYDVDEEPTKANLKKAITEWASDAENITLYFTDHGGHQDFTLNKDEILTADDLNEWLDIWQNSTKGSAKIIYDACHSGSFVQSLKDHNRIVITSAAADELAYFDDQGSLSFSNYFWTHVFNGLNMAESFSQATEAVNYLHDVQTEQNQTPWLEANGDGCVNKAADYQQAEQLFIGNGTYIHAEAPVIEAVSPSQKLTESNTALIYAQVNDDDIARVWAVVRSPVDIQRRIHSSSKGAVGQPVMQLPSFELQRVKDSNRYEGSYDDFKIAGRYELAIYARDRENNTSVPKTTSVFVENRFKRKAIMIAGDLPEDLPEGVQNFKDAYDTFKYQGYKNDNLYFISNTSVPGVAAQPVQATFDNVEFALTEWATDNTQNLVLYLEGLGNETEFRLSDTETVPFANLKTWLDALQPKIPGAVTVIYEGPFSGYLLAALKEPPEGKTRIVITSTGTGEIDSKDYPFSFAKFFWQKVYNGANTRNAFRYAKSAMTAANPAQIPQLEGNGNGIGNESDDKRVADKHSIGIGVVSASTESLGDHAVQEKSCLVPSQLQYHRGENVQVTLPILPSGSEQYFAVGLPNGDLYTIKNKNDFVLFQGVETAPAWLGGGNKAIDMPLDANIPLGGYRLYSVTLPEGTPLELPLNPETVCKSGFCVE